MTRISPRTKPSSSTAPPAGDRPWAARCSKTWATSRSTTSARSRIGPKAGARSTSRPSPARERRAVDGWTASRSSPIAPAPSPYLALDPLQHRVEVTRYWPVFNLADSAIVCGGILTVLLAMLGYHLDGTHGDRKAPPPGPGPGPGASPADA